MNMVYLATATLAFGAGDGLPMVELTSIPPVEAAFVQGQDRGQGQGRGQAQEQRGQGQSQPPAEARGRRDAAGAQRATGNERSGAQEPRGRAGGQQAPGQARAQESPRGQAGRGQPPAGDAADRRQEPRGRSAGQPGAATGQGQPAQARGRAGAESSGAGRGSAASSRAASSADATGTGRGDGRITQREIRERVTSLPAQVRRMGESRRRHEAVVGRAAALGTIWGLAPASLVVRTERDVVRVANRRNELLLDLDERRARDLGSWELSRIDHRRVRGNAPSFCRSGEGHPVWGREWCIRQGFGLGSDGVVRWSRAQVGDVIYRRQPDRTRLDRVTLIDVLGDVVFGRLALHALGMGYDRPLSGVWIAEPAAPRILRIYAGDAVVAEMVDLDRNDRVDVLYVAHRL